MREYAAAAIGRESNKTPDVLKHHDDGMIWPFFRKKNSAGPRLFYKDAQAFFEMQCKYGDTSIEPGKAVFALVTDPSKEFGTNDAIKIQDDGSQLAIVRVASEDGGFIVPATTPSARGDRLQPGDAVMWVPAEFINEFASRAEDPRFGWIGLIRAKVGLEMTSSNEFSILCRYD